MKTLAACIALLLPLLIGLPALPLVAQTYETDVVNASSTVLDEVMAMPGRSIPLSLLAHCQGVAIVPDLLKGGFIVGVRHGRGVLLVRDQTGTWQPPQFISITGGNVGFQAGLQATDLVLVFKTGRSIQRSAAGQTDPGRRHFCRRRARRTRRQCCDRYDPAGGDPLLFPQPGTVCGRGAGRLGGAGRSALEHGLLRAAGAAAGPAGGLDHPAHAGRAALEADQQLCGTGRSGRAGGGRGSRRAGRRAARVRSARDGPATTCPVAGSGGDPA